MPFPLLVIGAAIAGVAAGVNGAVKMKEAKERQEEAQRRHTRNVAAVKAANEKLCVAMDSLGKSELQVLQDFKEFSDLFEMIKNRPFFGDVNISGVEIPKLDNNGIKKASVGAAALKGGLEGAALGTVGGLAASGATTTAVMALGTASTGTAISSLGGAAATNATLAALGGGSLAAGGGGMALLGGATLGVGLLVGGLIFNNMDVSKIPLDADKAWDRMSSDADEAWDRMLDYEYKSEKIINYCSELQQIAVSYEQSLMQLSELYHRQLEKMQRICLKHFFFCNWFRFNLDEQITIMNTVGIVQVLYCMCKVKLVEKTAEESNSEEVNVINKDVIDKVQLAASSTLKHINSDPCYLLPAMY